MADRRGWMETASNFHVTPISHLRSAICDPPFACLCAAAWENPRLYGTRQIAHPGPGRGQRENVSRVLFADDRASRAGIQRSLRENPAAAPATPLHEAARVSLDVVRLGRDGRCGAQSGR